MPSSGRPGRRPYLPHLSLPLGHPKPASAKKEVSGPKRAAETRSGPAPDTCEAPHLKRTSRGPPGLPEHTPSAPRAARPPEPPYLRGPRATGARGASSSQWLPLPLRLPLPVPLPPPPPPSPPLEAGTRRAQDSTAMSAAPRTALWGGRDGEGEEEGKGEKEEDPLRGGGRGRVGALERGKGERHGALNGVLA